MTWVIRIISLTYGLPIALPLTLLWYASKIPKGMGTKNKHRAPAGAYMEYEQH